MRAGSITAMLERVDAFGHPERFEQLMTLCTCDFRAYPGRAFDSRHHRRTQNNLAPQKHRSKMHKHQSRHRHHGREAASKYQTVLAGEGGYVDNDSEYRKVMGEYEEIKMLLGTRFRN